MKTKWTFATLILTFMLCLSLTAAAQRIIDFNTLPHTDVRLPVPNGFGGMNWGNFNYVTDQLVADQRNFAFPTVGTATMSTQSPSLHCQPLGMLVRGDYGTTLTLYAYDNGVFVGSQSYQIAPSFTSISLPVEWGPITQITFRATNGQHQPAMFNLFSLTLQ